MLSFLFFSFIYLSIYLSINSRTSIFSTRLSTFYLSSFSHFSLYIYQSIYLSIWFCQHLSIFIYLSIYLFQDIFCIFICIHLSATISLTWLLTLFSNFSLLNSDFFYSYFCLLFGLFWFCIFFLFYFFIFVVHVETWLISPFVWVYQIDLTYSFYFSFFFPPSFSFSCFFGYFCFLSICTKISPLSLHNVSKY